MSKSNISVLENEVLEDALLDEEIEEIEASGSKIRPFLKWAGGKYKSIDKIKKKFPKECKRFVEPFLGAGSIALNVDYPHSIVNDTNKDLIQLWQFLKNKGEEFVSDCEKLFVDKNNKEDVFYKFRDEFNTTKDKWRKAILFVYLNRHCFNGLCRYNADGNYNVPFGKYDKPYFPREEFEICINKIKNFDFHNKDFREIFDLVQKDDLVYCDPPYLPMSETASFDAYAQGGFALKDQIELAELAMKAAKKGAIVVISNHYNWYSREIYVNMCGAKITSLDVARTISGTSNKRNPVKEILAVFKKGYYQ